MVVCPGVQVNHKAIIRATSECILTLSFEYDTLAAQMELTNEQLLGIVDRALTEDVEEGDVTTNCIIPVESRGSGVIRAKSAGVISGLDIATLVFYRLDSRTELQQHVVEGTTVNSGDEILSLTGEMRALLTGERTALNFLMRLSGIATAAAKFAEKVAGTGCQILDTRKTTPGLRLLEKRAVVAGGCSNHRVGLYDMILIKENHIAAAGSIERAVAAAIEYNETMAIQNLAIEVETRNLDEVKQTCALDIDRIMLDNFSVEETAVAVKLIRSVKPDLEIEASGNMMLDNVRAYADAGVDFISVGSITHSAPALDLSMTITPL